MGRSARTGSLIAIVLLAMLTAACGDATEQAATSSSRGDGLFPDVVDVVLTPAGSPGEYHVDVTLSSPYDTNERYADAWRVLDQDGNELGVRVLTHGHPTEQPFTRSLRRLVIPQGVEHVTIEGRDILNGWGGGTLTVPVEPPGG